MVIVLPNLTQSECFWSWFDYWSDPRGWPPGTGWTLVPGAFFPWPSDEVRVVIFGGSTMPPTGQGHGSFNLWFHELGHAVDDVLDLSTLKEFLAAYFKDLARMGSYYQQPDDAGPSEAFAEGFCRFFEGDVTLPIDWPHIFDFFDKRRLDKRRR